MTNALRTTMAFKGEVDDLLPRLALVDQIVPNFGARRGGTLPAPTRGRILRVLPDDINASGDALHSPNLPAVSSVT
jgi:hypothetical protein